MQLTEAVVLVAEDTRTGTDPGLTDQEAIGLTRREVEVQDVDAEPRVRRAYGLVLAATSAEIAGALVAD